MNRELLSVEPDSPRDDALGFILTLDITACPVIDEAGALKGMVSVRDLMPEEGGGTVRDRMHEPAVTVAVDAKVEDAAHKLARERAHRLVVLDAKGRAVGMVSAVDLVAALVGEPVEHPVGFPHVDAVAGVAWTNDMLLDGDNAERVPNAPGVLVLIHGGVGRSEVPVWVEEASNLRARVDSILGLPQDDAELALVLERDRAHLRMRVAKLEDAAERARAVAALKKHARADLRLG